MLPFRHTLTTVGDEVSLAMLPNYARTAFPSVWSASTKPLARREGIVLVLYTSVW
jgi:hypothetical protein